MAVLGLGVPERRAFGQPQLGPAPAGLPLLAGQPVAERGDEVVVRQLVVLARRSGLLRALGVGPFGVGRRDQPHVVVEVRSRLSNSLGRAPYPDATARSSWERMWPLMVVPLSGSRAFNTPWAAFW